MKLNKEGELSDSRNSTNESAPTSEGEQLRGTANDKTVPLERAYSLVVLLATRVALLSLTKQPWYHQVVSGRTTRMGTRLVIQYSHPPTPNVTRCSSTVTPRPSSRPWQSSYWSGIGLSSSAT